MAGQAPRLTTAQSCCATSSFVPGMMTHHHPTCCCLVCSCFSTQHSAQAQFPSLGTNRWSHQSSKEVMLQTRPTTAPLHWGTHSAHCTPAFWLNNWWSSLKLQLRFSTQAGYRPQHSTVHQTFVLQHTIEKHRHSQDPLRLCFVDLKSAYHQVQRRLLGGTLQRSGIQTSGAIHSLCTNCLLSMRVGGACGEGQWGYARAALSVPPSLASLTVSTITCSPHCPSLTLRYAACASQSWSMLMTFACWRQVLASCKP